MRASKTRIIDSNEIFTGGDDGSIYGTFDEVYVANQANGRGSCIQAFRSRGMAHQS